MLVSVLRCHLSLSLLKVEFVVEDVLGVSQVLDRPLVLLGILVLNCCLFVLYLVFTLLIDAVYLTRSESLEVVGHVSVRSKL